MATWSEQQHSSTNRPCHIWNTPRIHTISKDSSGCSNRLSSAWTTPYSTIAPDMDRVSAAELMMITAAEREQAYEELHGVFTKIDVTKMHESSVSDHPDGGGDTSTSSSSTSSPSPTPTNTTASAFEETPDLIQSSLVLLKMELERIPTRRKRAYLKACFLKPTLETDTSFQLMFLRADRFHVPLTAQRICSFFEQKQNLFGEAKLVHRLTLDDLSPDDIQSLCNGAGHLMPHKDRSGRLVFFADYFFLDFKDYTNVNRMAWYLAMAAVEDDEEAQKNGVVEVFFANHALGKQRGITEHLTKGLSALLSLPIRLVGIHFCYDSAVLKPIVQLTQMVFGAGNRLRFRPHFGSAMEVQYELLSYGIAIPTELLDRDTKFKAALDATYLSQQRDRETRGIDQGVTDESDVKRGLIEYPEGEDVLLGKGRSCQEYPGNQAMNCMIDKRTSEYRAANKDEKSSIALSIVDQIHSSGGRFLERIETTGWKVVTDQGTLRNKITQAFRVRNRVYVADSSDTITGMDELPLIKRFRN